MRFHRSLDGQEPQPFEHFIGRLSEEFGGALPSVIWDEWLRLPAGFMEQIVEYRDYARAKAIYEANPTADSAAKRLVMPIEFALAEQELRRG